VYFHKLKPFGVVMSPEPGNANEVEGVLNPAAARGPDGELYLFPRLVAKGNYSRIGIARVVFNADGDPTGVVRLGIALEPEKDYERSPSGGGCEDPRITFVEPFDCYVMTYVALSSSGPRIAVAISKDLFHWERLGLANFNQYHGVDFDNVDDKDALIFPRPVSGPSGNQKLAILHRPHFRNNGPQFSADGNPSRSADLDRKSIWISYGSLDLEETGPVKIGPFDDHQPLASPESPWETEKIGAGTPPILTKHGWLVIYHGVSYVAGLNGSGRELCYAAGLMVMAVDDPRKVVYRSLRPILALNGPEERKTAKGNVVFPTGIDRRDDIEQPDRYDIYYGMGDTRIGAARLDLPHSLPDPTTA